MSGDVGSAVERTKRDGCALRSPGRSDALSCPTDRSGLNALRSFEAAGVAAEATSADTVVATTGLDTGCLPGGVAAKPVQFAAALTNVGRRLYSKPSLAGVADEAASPTEHPAWVALEGRNITVSPFLTLVVPEGCM